ncbi:hypothetical protein BDW62DRAFT_115410 [Aspergillus aurantiobrunneus]
MRHKLGETKLTGGLIELSILLPASTMAWHCSGSLREPESGRFGSISSYRLNCCDVASYSICLFVEEHAGNRQHFRKRNRTIPGPWLVRMAGRPAERSNGCLLPPIIERHARPPSSRCCGVACSRRESHLPRTVDC